MGVENQKTLLKRLAKGIAQLFGPNCEVTVHDLSKGYENTIIAIENGHVTNRHVGDGASEKVLQALKDEKHAVKDEYNYLARTKEGRMIKSSSIYIRDDKDAIIGLLGINYDITDLFMAQHAIDVVIGVEKPNSPAKIGMITNNVSDLLDELIEAADNFVGKPVAVMSKDDKTHAIQFLNDHGAFLIKKAGDKVTKHYDISKYTLYNYMDSEG